MPLLLLFLTALSIAGPLKYLRVPTGYLMVLRQGDQVLGELEGFMEKEKIPSATFTGMGFVNAEFGFYNKKTKKFDPKMFNDVELASLTGSLAWKDGKPSIHAHGVVSGKDFKTYGGHLLQAQVGTGSVEVMILLHEKKLERFVDPSIGANVLDLTDSKKP